jgi:hypothetical protein
MKAGKVPFQTVIVATGYLAHCTSKKDFSHEGVFNPQQKAELTFSLLLLLLR